MKKITNLICVTLIVTLFAGCTKEGPAGPQGTAGASGAQGPQGNTGNANVNTAFGTAYAGTWYNSGGTYTYTFTTSYITNANDDLVMAYCQPGIGGAYFALPTTDFLANGDNMAFSYNTGTVTFYYIYTSAPIYNIAYKVVVIPPAIQTASPNTNWKDYNEVKKVMGLKD